MPFLLLDDAADQVRQRLQGFADQQFQDAQSAGQQLLGQGQQAVQQVGNSAQDATQRLMSFGQDTLSQALAAQQQQAQPQLQALGDQPSQTAMGVAGDASSGLQRLQDFGAQAMSDAISSVQQPASQAAQVLQPLNQPTPQQPSQAFPDQQQPTQAPQPGGDLQDYARAVAREAGIDPEIFVRQIQQESGFNSSAKSPAGAIGIAQFMPDTARSAGIDPTDPYASLKAAAKMDADNLKKYAGDWGKTLAAYNAGGGAVDQYGGVPPYKETQNYVNTILGGKNVVQQVQQGAGQAVQAASTGLQGGLQSAGQAASNTLSNVSQFGDQELSKAEAIAACGPAAAVRFAQLFGRNPTLREATNLAAQVGWTAASGMAGLGSESKLFDAMDIPHRTVGADWSALAREASSGNPVVISTPGHYFTADAYDPQRGFHVGQSGLDLIHGGEWMTPDQMQSLMGGLQGGLAVDHPLVGSPSVIAQGTAAVGNTVKAAGSAAQKGLQLLDGAIQDAAPRALDLASGGITRSFNEQLSGLGRDLTGGGPSDQQVQDTLNQGIKPVTGALASGLESTANTADQLGGGGIVPPELMRTAAGLLRQPGVLDSMQTVQDLQNKYQGADSSTYSAEDQRAYQQALLTVGGVLAGTTSEAFPGGTGYNVSDLGEPHMAGPTGRVPQVGEPQGGNLPLNPVYHYTGSTVEYGGPGIRPVGSRGFRYFADTPAEARAGAQTGTGFGRTLVTDLSPDIQIAQDVVGGGMLPHGERPVDYKTHPEEMPRAQFDAIQQRFSDVKDAIANDTSLTTDQRYAQQEALQMLQRKLIDNRNPALDYDDTGHEIITFGSDPSVPSWTQVERDGMPEVLKRLGMDAIRVADEAGTSLAVSNLDRVNVRQPNLGTTQRGTPAEVFYSGRGAPMREGPGNYGYDPSYDPGTSTLGRGLFATDDPRVAGGIVSPTTGEVLDPGYAQNKARGLPESVAGPNVRKVLVPDINTNHPFPRRVYTKPTPASGGGFGTTPRGQAMWSHFDEINNAYMADKNPSPELTAARETAAQKFLDASQKWENSGSNPDFTDTFQYQAMQEQRDKLWDAIWGTDPASTARADAYNALDAHDRLIADADHAFSSLPTPQKTPARPGGWGPQRNMSQQFHAFPTDQLLNPDNVRAVRNALETRNWADSFEGGMNQADPQLLDDLRQYENEVGYTEGADGGPLKGLDFWKWLGDRLAPDGTPLEKATATNDLLHDAGWDGIIYQGGKRQGMIDAATGQPILHRALMVFPQEVGRVTNATNFTARGEASAPAAAALGGVAALGLGAKYAADQLGDNPLDRLGELKDQAGTALENFRQQQASSDPRDLSFTAPISAGLTAASDVLEKRRQDSLDQAENLGTNIQKGNIGELIDSLQNANPMTSAASDVSSPISAGLTAAGVDPNVSRVVGQLGNFIAPETLEAGVTRAPGALARVAASDLARGESGALRLPFGGGILDQGTLQGIRGGNVQAGPSPTAPPRGPIARAVDYTKQALLSGPPTSVGNFVGNTLEILRSPAALTLGGRPTDAIAGLAAMGSGLPEAARATLATLGGNVPANLSNQAQRLGRDQPIWRMLSAADTFTRTLGEYQGMAERGSQLLRDAGISPSDPAAASFLQSHARDLAEAGGRQGTQSVFGTLRTASGGLGYIDQMFNRFNHFKEGLLASPSMRDQALGAILDFQIPFAGVPSKLLQIGVGRLPGVAQANHAVQAVQAARAGNIPEMQRQIGNFMLESIIQLWIAQQIHEGNIRGPDDPEHPGEIKVMGNWLNANLMGGYTLPAQIMAAFAEGASKGMLQRADDGGEALTNTFGSALSSSVKPFTEAIPGQQMVHMLGALGDGPGPALHKQLSDTISRISSPGAGKFIEDLMDPVARDVAKKGVGSLWQPAQARIPGLAELLPPKIDTTTGEPIEKRRAGPGILIGANSQDTSPIRSEVDRLRQQGYTDLNVPALPSSATIGGAEIRLSPDEQRHVAEITGKRLGDLGARLDWPAYQNAPDAQKARLLNAYLGTVDKTRNAAILEVLGRPELLRRQQLPGARSVVGRANQTGLDFLPQFLTSSHREQDDESQRQRSLVGAGT